MTLPTPNLDDRTWADLTQEAVALIPSNAPQWTDFNAHDPGITLLELLAYKTEQELYRLNTVGTAHRQAFLDLLGSEIQPAGAQPASTLLVYQPSAKPLANRASVKIGDYFQPWPDSSVSDTIGDPCDSPGTRRQKAGIDAPVLKPVSSIPSNYRYGYRAAHDIYLTGIRVSALQSYDGVKYLDLTDVLAHNNPAAVWGEDPNAPESSPPDRNPAFYIGFDLKLITQPAAKDANLSLWFILADGLLPGHSSDDSSSDSSDSSYLPYDPQSIIPPHHGLSVAWEYQAFGSWQLITGAAFSDETRGFSRPGRVVIPASVFQETISATSGSSVGTVVGVVLSPQFYIRCRLIRGRPDAAPLVRGIFADAVLVEQCSRTETDLTPLPRSDSAAPTLRDLQLPESTEDDIEDTFDDLVKRGWGPSAPSWKEWPITDQSWSALQKDYAEDLSYSRIPFVVLGVGDGSPNQQFKMPCQPGWPIPTPSPDLADPDPRAIVVTDSLIVWTMEPSWGWDPRGQSPSEAKWQRQPWLQVPTFVLCARTTPGYLYNPSTQTIQFGDGEAGRVPSPGALVVASYDWTGADAGNLAVGKVWGRSDDPALFAKQGPAAKPTVSFMNPIPAVGGQPPEELTQTMSRLAASFSATTRLLDLVTPGSLTTLDGIDLTGQLAPPMAVTQLDFECLARMVPDTLVARARAWPEVDPALPGIKVPGAVTVVIVPSLPADRPEPTPGLLQVIVDFLADLRPISCRVCVIGPQYQLVRIRATLHTKTGAGSKVLQSAVSQVQTFLHPLRGGSSGSGWPFGRAVHPGELLRVLTNVDDVQFVTDLQLATGDGPWGSSAIAVPPLSLVSSAPPELVVKEDA